MQKFKQVIAGRQATSLESRCLFCLLSAAEPEPEPITCQLKTPSVNPRFYSRAAMIAHWNVGQIIAWQLQHSLNSHCHGLYFTRSLSLRLAARFLDINPDAAAEKQFSTGMLNISLGTWADNDTRKHSSNTATILFSISRSSLFWCFFRHAGRQMSVQHQRRLSQKPRATTCTLCAAGRGASSVHCTKAEFTQS